ncbi:MAG TPA: hypothetical protein PKJ51_08960, partial [Methanothrix sp.]|nr:hypothetical protein [Methanothrix sp.]
MKPVTLIIMDGFGESDEAEGNAIAAARTPNIDRLKSSYPFTTIGAAGLDVGLGVLTDLGQGTPHVLRA